MTGQAKRTTITDVALHAGVSRAAVSKVLRGAYGVSGAMKARVEASMEVLEYRPSALARGMRGSSFTLGVFVVDLSNNFTTVLIEGIRKEAELQGYQVVIGCANRGLNQQQRMIEAMVDRKMDGLVLVAPFGPEEELEKIGRSTPTVVLGRHGPGRNYDTVASDDMAGSALVVNHLVSLGHRGIAHLMHVGSEKNESTMPQSVRAEGYVEAMLHNGLLEEVDVVEAKWNQEGGEAAVEEILKRNTPPTAIYAGSDLAAFGVLARLCDLGIPVPGDLSVVGYDNAITGSFPQIALTTVDQSGIEMGSTAARLLVERIRGRAGSQSILVPPTLVVRTTTAPPRQRHLLN